MNLEAIWILFLLFWIDFWDSLSGQFCAQSPLPIVSRLLVASDCTRPPCKHSPMVSEEVVPSFVPRTWVALSKRGIFGPPVGVCASNRGSRFGPKWLVAGLRHGGTWLIFGGPNTVAVAVGTPDLLVTLWEVPREGFRDHFGVLIRS